MDEQPGASKRILLVDDEQFIAIAYKDGLEHAGYQVTVAHDGDEALEQLRLQPPDLLLLDIIMPKTNGFEVLQAMKDDPSLAGIPVVVLTNLSQDTDEQEARRLGARDFITKTNVSMAELIARLEQLAQA
jgi:CheY-like chemotaxis protein